MRSIVIIPTYNEKENISNIIKAVLDKKDNFHVLIVDDSSPDGTGEIVKKLIQQNPERIFLEERKEKSGLGTAYIHGFKWAIQNDYEYIFEMDADFSHDPDDLPRLLHTCAKQDTDVCIGSRYVPGGKIINWPKTRFWLSYYASFYVRIILGIKIKDTTAGFKCYTKKVLEKIDLDNIWFVGYAFQIEMKYTAIKLGFKVKEIPIVFKDRELGESKMNIGIFKEAFIGVIKLRSKKFEK
jgi:dolichol-phosphate mannosyltransferase